MDCLIVLGFAETTIAITDLIYMIVPAATTTTTTTTATTTTTSAETKSYAAKVIFNANQKGYCYQFGVKFLGLCCILEPMT